MHLNNGESEFAMKFGKLIASVVMVGWAGGVSTLAQSTPSSAAVRSPSTVYFTHEITPESLVAVFDALGCRPSAADKVAVKISTGEAGGHNYLKPELISNLVAAVRGTIVECNTAYPGKRNTSEAHWQTIRDHGFTAIAKVDLMDEFGEVEIPVRDKTHIKADLVGASLTNYTFMVNLAHFKGHAMGGFGGVLKNQSIGVASANGKARIHSAGKTDSTKMLWASRPGQDDFLESMAAAAQGVHDYFGGGKIVYINVLNNLSVDCDCSAHPAAPKMKDLGIMASLDPVALDQAAFDMVSGVPVAENNDNRDLLARIAKRHGTHIIDHAEEIGLGSKYYTLVHLGFLKHPELYSYSIPLTMEALVGMIRRGDAECVIVRLPFYKGQKNGEFIFDCRGHGRGISPLLDLYDSAVRENKNAFDRLSVEEKLKTVAPEKPFANRVIVDKIIGRAAAFIAVSGGAKAVHGEIMCEGARALLETNGISATCSLLVPQIRDRSYGHLCPLEDSVREIADNDAPRAMEAIRARIVALRSGAKIETPALPPPSRTLVAYYSRSGNTRFAAEVAAHALNADIFEIKPLAPYSEDYKSCLAVAKAETEVGARPTLAYGPAGMGDYARVYVFSPVWCGVMAPPVATFLSVADLADKEVFPFFTHGGGGAEKALADFTVRTGIQPRRSGAWKGADVRGLEQAIRDCVLR